MPNHKRTSKNSQPRLTNMKSLSKNDFKRARQSPTPPLNAQELILKVGIEIECLARLDNGGKIMSEVARDKRYTIVENDMRQILKDNPVIKVYDKGNPQISKHEIWVLKYDPSLQGKSHHDNTCPVEIISPILFDHNERAGEMWKPLVERIWWALDQRGGVSTNTTCGTHVHLSPKSTTWTLKDLQKLSCCILYFERAFEVLYPEARRECSAAHSRREIYAENARKNKRAKHAKANWVDNRKFGAQYSNNVDLICGTKNIVELIGLMNPLGQEYNRSDVFDRAFAWNFNNMKQGGTGTVEYRRPPGVQRLNACISWVRLAITFVRAAIQIKDPYFPLQGDLSDAQYMDVNRLKRFLEAGLPVGHNIRTYLGSLFGDKKGSLDVIPVKERYPEDDSDSDADE